MDAVSITDFLKAVNGQANHKTSLPNKVQGISLDSRTLKRGEVFWAIRGENHDGHEYVKSALEKGASACLVETTSCTEHILVNPHFIQVKNTLTALARFAKWYRSQYAPLTIGITGSYGKTTTRELLYSVLSVRQLGLQNPNNYNNEIGVPLTLLNLNREHQFLIVEMGAAKANDILPLTDITSPHIGIITGIGPAHLRGFKTIEEIVKTKGDLLASLPKEGLALVPGDSEWANPLSKRAKCRVITFGLHPSNDYHIANTHCFNTSLTFQTNGNEYHLPLSGRHHLTTGLAVITLATELGYSPEEIQQGFDRFQPIAGRGNIRQVLPWTIIDDTYNANPASCRAACDLLATWKTMGHRILVLGDMLELESNATAYHETLGRYAAELGIDVVLTIGTHAADLTRGIETSDNSKTLGLAFADPRELVKELQKIIKPNDVVLVKGSRGMRMERIVQTLLRQEDHEPSIFAA